MYTKIPLNRIKKISLIQTSGQKTLDQVKTESQCDYIINGTLYDLKTYAILCPCRINGKTQTTSKDKYWCYGWDVGPDFKMIHSDDMDNYQNVFSCCTMLKDGNNTTLIYNPDQGGTRGRTAIGIDNQNNLVLFCSKDGTSEAKTPENLRDYMKTTLLCQSAIMLDSGGSSQCNFKNQKIISSSRKVANYICIWEQPKGITKNTTILDKLKTLENTKNNIKKAIENKGQSCQGALFEQYPEKISAIQTGRDTSTGNVTADEILQGKIAFNSFGEVRGTMPNNQNWADREEKCLPTAVQDIVIPKGYHNGQGFIRIPSLSSGTPGNATSDTILSGYSAWVKGKEIKGTYTPQTNPIQTAKFSITNNTSEQPWVTWQTSPFGEFKTYYLDPSETYNVENGIENGWVFVYPQRRKSNPFQIIGGTTLGPGGALMPTTVMINTGDALTIDYS